MPTNLVAMANISFAERNWDGLMDRRPEKCGWSPGNGANLWRLPLGWVVCICHIQFILVINQQSLDLFKDKSMGNRGFWHELCVDSFWTKSSGKNLGNNLQAEVLDQLPAAFLEVLGDHQQEWPATEAVSWRGKCWSRRSGLFKTTTVYCECGLHTTKLFAIVVWLTVLKWLICCFMLLMEDRSYQIYFCWFTDRSWSCSVFSAMLKGKPHHIYGILSERGSWYGYILIFMPLL